jgi:hypothetical protein
LVDLGRPAGPGEVLARLPTPARTKTTIADGSMETGPNRNAGYWRPDPTGV